MQSSLTKLGLCGPYNEVHACTASLIITALSTPPPTFNLDAGQGVNIVSIHWSRFQVITRQSG